MRGGGCRYESVSPWGGPAWGQTGPPGRWLHASEEERQGCYAFFQVAEGPGEPANSCGTADVGASWDATGLLESLFEGVWTALAPRCRLAEGVE